MFHVNEYLTNRAYGGPEEGGWFYDVGHFIKSHGTFESEQEAYRRRDELTGYLEEKRAGQRPPYSVACTGYTELWIEDGPGEDFPIERPHYE